MEIVVVTFFVGLMFFVGKGIGFYQCLSNIGNTMKLLSEKEALFDVGGRKYKLVLVEDKEEQK